MNEVIVVADIRDVAAYILEKAGPMTAMKLQKLAYYSQAWHLVWEDRPLYSERIEAWANGPVSPRLYAYHRGRFRLERGDIGGDATRLDEDELSTIDSVIEFYGKRSAYELSELTHREEPWRHARGETPVGQWCDEEITPAAMAEYYGSLTE